MATSATDLVGVWDGEPGLSDLRIVEREGWNGPPEQLVKVLDYVVERLRGQCQEDLQRVLEKIGLFYLETVEFCSAVDAEVFCCDTCGWWCEMDEESESSPGSCTNCCPDEDY